MDDTYCFEGQGDWVTCKKCYISHVIPEPAMKLNSHKKVLILNLVKGCLSFKI